MRPDKLILVAGTGTDIGKTWVTASLIFEFKSRTVAVCGRKPAQSFDPGDSLESSDAGILGRANGEDPERVCPPSRWYKVAMAPPMAADFLGLDPISIDDLLGELNWPQGCEIGFLESAGGLRSPLAHNGDTIDLLFALAPDLVLLVATSGLGTLNNVRLSHTAIGRATRVPCVVVLNRFDPSNRLHLANAAWLRDRDQFLVVTTSDEVSELCSVIQGIFET